MSVLITGAAGFIGSSLSARLLELGYSVTAVDDFNPYYNPQYKRENVQPFLSYTNYTVLEGDISDRNFLKNIFAKRKFEKVVHLAASVGVRNSLLHPKLYHKNNVVGTQALLEEMVRHNVSQFIFASSSSIYGNNSPIPFREDTVLDSRLSPYAQTKKDAEAICQVYHEKYSIPVTVFRFFTVYGPKGRPDMSPYIFTKAVLEGKPVRIYGDGSARRDFTYIDDIVNGIMLAVDKPLEYEIFNLANSAPVRILDFIKMIGDRCNKTPNLVFLPRNDFEMLHTYADISKAKEVLGYRPETTLENGLKHFTRWFRRNNR